MTVTIIKGGKNEFVGRCKWCGCEFRYETADVKEHNVLDRVIYCPQAGCGRGLKHYGEHGTSEHGPNRNPMWAQYNQQAAMLKG